LENHVSQNKTKSNIIDLLVDPEKHFIFNFYQMLFELVEMGKIRLVKYVNKLFLHYISISHIYNSLIKLLVLQINYWGFKCLKKKWKFIKITLMLCQSTQNTKIIPD
jgi:uncharacterized phage infection (PIP) family protein YhgE